MAFWMLGDCSVQGVVAPLVSVEGGLEGIGGGAIGLGRVREGRGSGFLGLSRVVGGLGSHVVRGFLAGAGDWGSTSLKARDTPWSAEVISLGITQKVLPEPCASWGSIWRYW